MESNAPCTCTVLQLVSLRQTKRLLQPFPEPATVNFAIDRRLGPRDEELKRFLRALRSCKLSAFGIDPPPDDPNRHLKILRIPRDKPNRQLTPDWKSCLRAGQLDGSFIIKTDPHADRNVRGISYEPGISIPIGRPCLACHRTSHPENSRLSPRAPIHHPFQQRRNKKRPLRGGCLTSIEGRTPNGLPSFTYHVGQCDRTNDNASIGEPGVGRCNLKQRYRGTTQRHGQIVGQRCGNSKRMQQTLECSHSGSMCGPNGRNVQGLFECRSNRHLPSILPIVILRLPGP